MEHLPNYKINLSNLRILITNDDGIHAPGLKFLEKIARILSKDVWVVAPEQEQSGAAHSLTLSRPLRIRKVSSHRFSINGTPTDCVLMAVNHILKKNPPTLILSGINYMGNLGEEVTYSGTVAAAMEGTLLGIPSIALSQVVTLPHPAKWATAAHFGPLVIRHLLKTTWPQNVLININFPDVISQSVTGVKIVSQGLRATAADDIIHNIDPRGKPYYWIGPIIESPDYMPDTDLDTIAKGAISVTPLHLDLTHWESLKALKTAFQGFKLEGLSNPLK